MGKTVGLVFEPVKDDVTVFHCPVCGKEYKNQDALTRHIADKHPEYQGEQE